MIAGRHLALAALISFALASVLCLSDDFFDEAYYARWYGKIEIAKLADAITTDSQGRLSIEERPDTSHYWSPNNDAYAFRIWDEAGRQIAGANAELLSGWSPIALRNQTQLDAWQRKFGAGWFETISGRQLTINGKRMWIEVGTRGDPLDLRYGALWADFVHDVLRPLTPTFLIAGFLALLSLRRALRPISAAAATADAVTPSADSFDFRIATDGLPREVAVLADAVNTLLTRVAALIDAQSEFIGRAAHQLRTPLATMMLDVERSGLPSASHLQRSLDRMSDMVDRLLELARLESAPPVTAGILELRDLIDDVVLDTKALASQRGGRIRVVGEEHVFVRGDCCTLREAVMNLISNAIVHHPNTPHVVVTCGPGPQLTIDDDGLGLVGISPDEIFKPFSRGASTANGSGLGLALVKRVIDLHSGDISVTRSPTGGARFTIRLLPADPPQIEGNAGGALAQGRPVEAAG